MKTQQSSINNYDNSAVEEYVNSLTQRETENIRALKISNDRNHALIQMLKFCIFPLILSLAILIVMAGVSSTNSFEQIKRNYVTIKESSTVNNQTREESVPVFSENPKESFQEKDQIFDIEALLKKVKKEGINNIINEKKVDEQSITDYVIFSHEILNLGNINKLTVGNKYSDISKETPKLSWCYLTLSSNKGVRETVHLLRKEGKDRNVYQISTSVRKRMNISKTKLNELRSKCGI